MKAEIDASRLVWRRVPVPYSVRAIKSGKGTIPQWPMRNGRMAFLGQCCDQSGQASFSWAQGDESTVAKPLLVVRDAHHHGLPAADDRKPTKANAAMHPVVVSEDIFCSPALQRRAFYASPDVLIFNMDVGDALRLLAQHRMMVNCIVTSPPFYGQRDYEVRGQIGLENHPLDYVKKLVEVFGLCKPILADNGSLWVNIGDTYWSGKGEHKSGEVKQSARRFGLRPQDKKGDGGLCVPKQLLLIPHRFAIAMQEEQWIVRNDNVWVKPNPIPDQVRDRCSTSHEYVFHFVKERWYYFDKSAVGRPTESGSLLPPLDTWEVAPVRGNKVPHRAMFSQELVKIPICTTTPHRGVVLDPFGGSGTSLVFARRHGHRCIGIDIKREFCQLMVDQLRQDQFYDPED